MSLICLCFIRKLSKGTNFLSSDWNGLSYSSPLYVLSCLSLRILVQMGSNLSIKSTTLCDGFTIYFMVPWVPYSVELLSDGYYCAISSIGLCYAEFLIWYIGGDLLCSLLLNFVSLVACRQILDFFSLFTCLIIFQFEMFFCRFLFLVLWLWDMQTPVNTYFWSTK